MIRYHKKNNCKNSKFLNVPITTNIFYTLALTFMPSKLQWKFSLKIQGPRIQVTAITSLCPCLINKKNITFVKTNFKFLVLLSNCWESVQKKSTRNLREGVTATIKDQPILFIDKFRAQTTSSITIFFRASLLVVLSNWDNQKYS